MVNRSYYPSGEDMPALRRYGSRGPTYAMSHDREPALNHDTYQSRPQHIPSHDRNSDRRSPDSDLSSRPRSRIPVACGRCRKRKIKCSGDNGGPCTSCKQAQHDQCQFLRVSSMTAQMKTEVLSYDYDVSNSGAASRMNSRIPQYGPHSYVPHSPLPVEASYPFRSNSLSTYQFPPRTYYSMPPFNEYADGATIDYDLHNPSYQAYGTDNLAMPANFTPSGASRGWNAAPQVARNSLFLEQVDTPYNHGQIGYHASNFPLRTQVNSESRSLSLNGIASTLPAPLTTDRLLPIPATHRQMPVTPYHRTSESVLPASQIGWPNFQGDYPRTTLKSQNMQPISENGSIASSYLPMASSSPESIASSQMTYNSQQMSMGQHQQQQGDMFTPPGTDSMYATESSDSSYEHSSSGSKRGSHSSQASHADTSSISSLPPIATDSLSNGQRYVPVPYQSSNYPAPPMNNINIPSNVSAHQASILIEN